VVNKRGRRRGVKPAWFLHLFLSITALPTVSKHVLGQASRRSIDSMLIGTARRRYWAHVAAELPKL